MINHEAQKLVEFKVIAESKKVQSFRGLKPVAKYHETWKKQQYFGSARTGDVER